MALIAALVLAAVVTPVGGWLARRMGLVDRPGPLKPQARAVPYLGALGVLAGIAVLAFERPWLLLPLVAAAALGVVDDARQLPPTARLGGEVAIGVAAALIVDVRLPGVLAVLAVAAALTALVNSVNLIDGLDGLAGGVVLASAAGFAVVLSGSDRTVALAICGAVAGFLPYNRPPARVFLGDGGAYLLGASLAVLLALAWGPGRPASLAVGSLLFVVVPLVDTAVALVRRVRAHRPLFEGDRGHVYDQLVERGWHAGAATVVLVAAQAVLSAAGVVATHLPLWAASTLVAGCGGAVAAAIVAGRFLTWSPAPRP